MSVSPAVQAARKQMQMKRLDAKQNDLENYPAFYAAQPAQVERARVSKIYKDAIRTLKDADDVLEVAIITGEGLESAQEARAIAAKVAEMAQPPRRGASASASLSGV